MGRVYRDYAKQHPWVRPLAGFMWRYSSKLFFIWRRLRHFRNKDGNKDEWLELVTQAEFSSRRMLPKFYLTNRVTVQTPCPSAYPPSKSHLIASKNEGYEFPSIYVLRIPAALVSGGTNLVASNAMMLSHDMFNCQRDLTSEELHARVSINPTTLKARFLVTDHEPEMIQTAASFVDACAVNYAHWITEVLPRIALFCAETTLKNIPIIVNNELHDNAMRSVLAIAGPNREVICLPVGRSLKVSKLYLTSCAGYVPFEPRGRQRPDHSHGFFSPDGFAAIRAKTVPAVSSRDTTTSPKKIYISRNAGYRTLENDVQVRGFLTENGFTVITPELLSFPEQVKVFSQADIIVGASGAAMANIVFCRPSTRICILISSNKNLLYNYWQNIACSCGSHIFYVLGTSAEGSVHANFSIDLSDLSDAIADV